MVWLMIHKSKVILISSIITLSISMMIGGALSSSYQEPEQVQKQESNNKLDVIGSSPSLNNQNYSNSCCTTSDTTQQNYQPSCCISDSDDYSENEYRRQGGCCQG